MHHYNYLKTTISSILISAGLVACVGENNTASVSPRPLASAKSQVHENKQEHGLIGHYFAKSDFQDQLFQAQHLSANLSFNQDELEILKNLHKNEATDSRKQVQVQSVYWTGYIQFNKNMSSILQLSPMNAVKKRLRAQIYINGQLLKPNTPFEFSANKYYKIKISINSANSILSMLHELNPVLISINTHAGTVEQVQFANLFTPNKLPRESQSLRSTAESTALEEHDVIRENALSGFVIEASGDSIIAKQWLPGYYADGKLKLYSSVNADTTLGGASPWKDQDKINALSSTANLAISYDALNPVVAAYPIIRPIIDTIQVAVNQSIATGSSNGNTTGAEQSITNTKVHEVTNSHSINAGANLGGALKEGANAGLNFSYTHNWGTSDTTTTGSEQSNSLSLSVENSTSTTIDTNNYANIQLAMRFKNVGTATINNFQPSFNISVFKDNKLVPAMQTIHKNDNRIIENINPWEVYPKLNDAPDNYATSDDFNGTKIQLTKDNFELLSKYPIYISIPELFTKNDAETKVDWGKTIGQINQQTALFILRTPRADIERRVFALNSERADLQRNFYPELNLRDAFYVAFQLIPPTISKKFWQYNAKFNINNYLAIYQFESLQVLSDGNTYSNMMDQKKLLSKVESDIIDTYKIRAQMQFILAPIGWVVNSESNNTKSYATLEHGFYRNEAAEIDGKWYLFDANGELVKTSGLHEIQEDFQTEKKRYYVEFDDGSLCQNKLKSDNGKTWLCNKDATISDFFPNLSPDYLCLDGSFANECAKVSDTLSMKIRHSGDMVMPDSIITALRGYTVLWRTYYGISHYTKISDQKRVIVTDSTTVSDINYQIESSAVYSAIQLCIYPSIDSDVSNINSQCVDTFTDKGLKPSGWNAKIWSIVPRTRQEFRSWINRQDVISIIKEDHDKALYGLCPNGSSTSIACYSMALLFNDICKKGLNAGEVVIPRN